MIRFTENDLVSMGLSPKSTYGGSVASFTCPATGDYVWPIEVLADVLALIKRRQARLVADRNEKLRALFAAQSSRLRA